MYRKSPDNVYYDIVIYNDGTAPFIRATYDVNKTQPILGKASDYYLAVSRATIPLNTIPLLVCPIVPNQIDPNLTPLVIGIRDYTSGISYPQNVIFTPELTQEPLPVQNQPNQVISEYYYIYAYTTLIQMFNTALLDAFAAFSLAIPTPPQASFPCPFFIYNPDTQLMSLVAHKSWFFDINSNPLTANVIFTNSAAVNYLDGFQSIYVPTGVASPVFSFNNVFAIYNRNNNGYPTNVYPAVPDYVQMTQDYLTTKNWISLRKILITSTSLPCPGEDLPVPGQSQDEYTSFPIISDFEVQLDGAGVNGDIMYYDPQIYRLVDMMYDASLNKINLRIYWGDKIGNIYPLTISAFNSVSVKLLFINKDLQKACVDD